jgi:hypothetical protein
MVNGIVEGGTPIAVYVQLDDTPITLAEGKDSWGVLFKEVELGRHNVGAVAISDTGMTHWSYVDFHVGEDVLDLMPNVGILKPVNNTIVERNVQVEGWATDDKEITYVEIKINDGDWIRADGSTNWKYRINDYQLDEGWNVISARAYDGSHYSDNKASRFFFIPGDYYVGGQSGIYFVFMIIFLTSTIILLISFIKNKRNTRITRQ